MKTEIVRKGVRAVRRLLLAAQLLGLVTYANATPESAALRSTDEGQAAVVLLDSAEYRILSESEQEYAVKRIIEIRDEAGKSHCQVMIRESEFMKPEGIKGKVTDRTGKTLYTLQKGDINKFCGFEGYSLYSNICTYSFQLSAGSYPFTIEYEYKVKSKSLFFWPDWIPQEDLNVRNSSYTLVVPSDFEFDFSTQGDAKQPAISETRKTRTYLWSMSDVPPLKVEDYSPPSANYRTMVKFAPKKFKLANFAFDGSTWKTLSRDYYSVAEDCFRLSKQQKLLLKELLASKLSETDLENRLHEILSRKLRYVAVSIGVGGWQPHVSEETYAHGYGDCKDLSTMYASMLTGLGLNARLAVALTRNEGRVDTAFARLNGFNHMILFVPHDADTDWVDPTCFDCKFNDLPWTVENTKVLAIDTAGGRLVHTPSSRATDNVIVRKALLTPSVDLSVTVQLDLTAVGNPSHTIRAALQDCTDKECCEQVKQLPGILSSKVTIDKCSVDRTRTELSYTNLELGGKALKYLRRIDDKLYLDCSLLPLFQESELVRLTERQYPIFFAYPKSFVDTITVSLPPDLAVNDLPSDTSLTDRFGELRISYSISGNRIVISRRKSLDVYELTKDDFEEFAKHRETFQRAAGKSLVFQKR